MADRFSTKSRLIAEHSIVLPVAINKLQDRVASCSGRRKSIVEEEEEEAMEVFLGSDKPPEECQDIQLVQYLMTNRFGQCPSFA